MAVSDEMRSLLTEFTDRCWDYDTIACAICDGPIDWDDDSDHDREHDRFPMKHYPDCLWVKAHRLLARDLGAHSA